MSRLNAARRALDAGELERAEALASEAIREDAGPAALALYGDIVGRLRDRAEAEEWLSLAIEQYPRDAYLYAVRGEQRIRQGHWDQGSADFIGALALDDPEGDAATHVHRVVDELLDAVHAGKVPAEGATRFINRLDYSTSKSPELGAVFGSARRALSQGTTLREQGAAAPPPRARAEAPGQDAAAPARPPIPDGQRTTARSRPPASAPASALDLHTGTGAMAASQARLDALIRHDRALNERLQESVGEVGIPVWPSENPRRGLDPLPPLRPEGLGRSLGRLRQSAMALTTGSIDAEILLERCLDELVLAAQLGSAPAPTLDRVGLTRLELAMGAGALDALPGVTHRDQLHPPASVALYGLGTFLGDCLVRGYGGTWSFDDTPVDSRVHIGEHVFDPLGVAMSWLDAADKDDVALEAVLASADRVATRDARLESPRVDPTAELTKQALALKLAEAWAATYPLPKDVSLVEVAAAIRPVEVGPRTIVFTIDPAWAPPRASFADAAGIAYVRRTGECLVLASRKHFARFVAERFDGLDPQTAQEIVRLYVEHHRPGLRLTENPRLVEGRGGARALVGDGWRLTYAPDRPLPWQLDHGEG